MNYAARKRPRDCSSNWRNSFARAMHMVRYVSRKPTALADILINDHRETWPVRTKGFRRWLARQFFEQIGGAPGSEALQSALNVIEAKAHFDGPERPVFIRVGGLDGRLYLDLAGC